MGFGQLETMPTRLPGSPLPHDTVRRLKCRNPRPAARASYPEGVSEGVSARPAGGSSCRTPPESLAAAPDEATPRGQRT